MRLSRGIRGIRGWGSGPKLKLMLNSRVPACVRPAGVLTRPPAPTPPHPRSARGPDLPPKVCIIAGRSKGKEGGGLPTVKDCMGALLRALGAPFKEAPDSSQSIGRLEASGQEVAEWLLAEGRTALAAIVPPPPSAAGADDTYAGEPPAEAHAQGTAADAEQQVEQGGAAGEGAPAPSAAVAAAAAAAAAVAGLPRSAVRGDGSEADAEAQDELSIETK